MVTDHKHDIKYYIQLKKIVDLIWHVKYQICRSLSEHGACEPHKSMIQNMSVYNDGSLERCHVANCPRLQCGTTNCECK